MAGRREVWEGVALPVSHFLLHQINARSKTHNPLDPLQLFAPVSRRSRYFPETVDFETAKDVFGCSLPGTPEPWMVSEEVARERDVSPSFGFVPIQLPRLAR